MTDALLVATLAAVVAFTTVSGLPGPPTEPIRLWPGAAPGDQGYMGPERDTTPAGPDGKPQDHVIRLGNVTVPTITIFKPPKNKDTGAAVVVCPCGGYYILAWDLEGTEICEWLNSIGVTGVLLKYRVPTRVGRPHHEPPLQDAQRAMGIVRHNAAAWGIDPARIGILGFSTGGHLSAALSTNHGARIYPPVDDADSASCRPDFTVLIYPAYLADKVETTKTAPELPVTKATPPAFLAMTMDDEIGVGNVFTYATALKHAGVGAEVHVYPSGGHGYGLRTSKNLVRTWPARAADWMKSQGWLAKKR